MKTNFLYGIVLALGLFMSGTSWALPVDTVVSMATSPDYDNDTGTPMCNVIVPAGTVAMACRLGSTSVAYYQLTNVDLTVSAIDSFERTARGYFALNINNRIPKTLTACGFVSELDDVPTKVPIAA